MGLDNELQKDGIWNMNDYIIYFMFLVVNNRERTKLYIHFTN